MSATARDLTWPVSSAIVLVVVIGVAISNGRDNSGETVQPASWADDVCGTVGAWQGQLKDIGDDVRHNNWARVKATAPPAIREEHGRDVHGPSTGRSGDSGHAAGGTRARRHPGGSGEQAARRWRWAK